MRGKSEAVKQKVKTTAKEIYDKHFRAAQAQPRGTIYTQYFCEVE
jgi:hypothetical protein